MAIFALIVFPMFFMSLAVKTFKNINNSVPGTDSSDADTQQRIGNIRIEPKSKHHRHNLLAHKLLKILQQYRCNKLLFLCK